MWMCPETPAGSGVSCLRKSVRFMITPFSSTYAASAASTESHSFTSPGAMASSKAWSRARNSWVRSDGAVGGFANRRRQDHINEESEHDHLLLIGDSNAFS